MVPWPAVLVALVLAYYKAWAFLLLFGVFLVFLGVSAFLNGWAALGGPVGTVLLILVGALSAIISLAATYPG